MANDGIRPNMHNTPTVGQMMTGHDGQPAAVRAPVWPPMILQPTAKDVFSIFRSFSCGLAAADTDNALNTTATRSVIFDIPVICYAVTGSVRISDGSGFPAGMNPLDSFTVLLQTANGEKVTIDTRMAGGFLGTAQRPGFLGGAGWVWNPGTRAVWEITPVLAGIPAGAKLVVDIQMHCIEIRRGASYIGSV